MKIYSAGEAVSIKRNVDSGTGEQLAAVKGILGEVRTRGDEAVREFTAKFDRVELLEFTVTEEEVAEAYEMVDKSFIDVIREASANIRDFHEKQLRPSWMAAEENGTLLGQKITPLDSAGVYVPGGTAAYPSSVLMNVIPAQVAGVGRI